MPVMVVAAVSNPSCCPPVVVYGRAAASAAGHTEVGGRRRAPWSPPSVASCCCLVLWGVAISAGWAGAFGGPRHRCVVCCAVCTRCVTARGSVATRQWLFLRAPRICSPCINLGSKPRRRRQRLLAAAETSAVVLCTHRANASPISRVQTSSVDAPFCPAPFASAGHSYIKRLRRWFTNNLRKRCEQER